MINQEIKKIAARFSELMGEEPEIVYFDTDKEEEYQFLTIGLKQITDDEILEYFEKDRKR